MLEDGATLHAPRPFVEAQDVSRVFGSGQARVAALDGVDVQICADELTVVLGPSGSGKSTLLNLLGGMDSPTSGSVRVGSQEVSSLGDRGLTEYRRHQVGFVFQFYNLIPNLTAVENVTLAAGLVTDRRTALARSRKLLDQVGLAARFDSFPRQLSGGEMQRVAIARALAKQPALLLCDEPTGALDSRTGEQVLELLRATSRDSEAAIVLVTHSQEVAAAADRIVRLQDGRVVPEGGV